MHALFSSVSGHGHTFPLLPLARALVASGHRVTFAVDERHHPMLAALGMGTERAGLDLDSALARVQSRLGKVALTDRDSPDLLSVVVTAFMDVVPRAFVADLVPLLERTKPDLVVYDAGTPGAAIAAKVHGIPVAAHGICSGAAADMFPGAADALRAVAADWGVAVSPTSWLDLGHPYLDIYPESMQDKEILTRLPDRRPMRPVPFCPPVTCRPGSSNTLSPWCT